MARRKTKGEYVDQIERVRERVVSFAESQKNHGNRLTIMDVANFHNALVDQHGQLQEVRNVSGIADILKAELVSTEDEVTKYVTFHSTIAAMITFLQNNLLNSTDGANAINWPSGVANVTYKTFSTAQRNAYYTQLNALIAAANVIG